MKPLTIGVAGGSGSGKTTVVGALMQALGPATAAVLPHDAYYRHYPDMPFEQRIATNWDHPQSLDTELLVRHVSLLLAGETIERPVYDFSAYLRLDETLRVEPKSVVIVEGILILTEKELRDLLDIRIYVDTDADIRFLRRLQRDIEERARSVPQIVEQYMETVRPMHMEFVEPSKRYANIVIPEGGHNRVAIDVLVNAVKFKVQSSRFNVDIKP